MANKNIVLENARIGFRNFSGEENKFNPAGRRNFCVFLDSEYAEDLAAEGWNVKYRTPRNPDDDPLPYLQVTVKYGDYPPKVFMISSKGKKQLDENTISILDFAEIANTDLIIRPYNYDVNGKTGVKAYLKSMYVTLMEDEFEKKYQDIPDNISNSTVADDEEVPF